MPAESTHISKKEFRMFCLEVVIALALWALQKNPISVSICLILMAAIAVPIVRYSEWVQRKKVSKKLAFVLSYAAIGIFGWFVWPRVPVHGTIAQEVHDFPLEPFFPYHPGKAKMNVYYRNAGNALVRNTKFVGEIKIVQSEMSEDELFSDFIGKASFSPTENELPVNSQTFFKTIYSRDLTPQDVNLLSGPTPMSKMCAVAAIRWEDETGQYESDLCGCMEPNRHPGATPPAAMCQGHNGVWRTR